MSLFRSYTFSNEYYSNESEKVIGTSMCNISITSIEKSLTHSECQFWANNYIGIQTPCPLFFGLIGKIEILS